VVSNYSVPNNIGGEAYPSTTTTTGKIILLMDQDEAGISAVERLCGTSQILCQLTTNSSNSGVDVMVASLPKGFKDPDEFIQHKRTSLYNVDNAALDNVNNIKQHINDERSTIQQIFEQEIVQKAQDWKCWYLNLLLSKHNVLVNDTAIVSIATHNLLYEQVSDFISMFPNAHMQSYLAKQFVNQCSERLNGTSEIWDDNITHHVDSATTLTQIRTVADYKVELETELWSMIQKKVEKRERKVNFTIMTQPNSSFKLRDFQRFDKSNNERRLSLIQASIFTSICVKILFSSI
jgi:DNA primase